MTHAASLPPFIVFELDGTLANTGWDLVATLNVILGREGLSGIALSDARPMVSGSRGIDSVAL
jgi:phosphoglycolate phosphatase